MLVNAPPTPVYHQWSLGEIILDECRTYTYLGEVIAQSLVLDDHIKHVRERSFWVTSTMFATASETTLSMLKMGSLLQLYRSCWLHAVLYNAGTWTTTQRDDTKLAQIQLTLLRRILKVPSSTPKAAIFGELGIQPIQYDLHRRQLALLHKLLTSAPKLPKLAFQNQLNYPHHNSWITVVQPLLARYGLPKYQSAVQVFGREPWRRLVNKALHRHFTQWFREEAVRSTKLLKMSAHKLSPCVESYVTQMSRNQVSAIFRLRCGMTKSPANHSSGAPTCPRCSAGLGSDQHALSCCPSLQQLRTKYNIQGISPVFSQSSNVELMSRYAAFLQEAELIPEL